ncbi:MAG TPA: ATP synthase F1 subunit gamma [Chlorobiota bacterium]|nr:ATP synthase F1 subunit gamma [Chlorobiota bacterium]
MATLRETRTRITSVRNTSKITQAMRMVAAAKLRRAQDAITSARPFAQQLQKILGNLAAAETDFVHPFFESRADVRSVLVIAVSSDRGLCGAFNTNLLRATTLRLEAIKKQHPDAVITIIPVGRRAVSALRKRSEEIVREYPDIFLKLEFTTAKDIAEYSADAFLGGRADRVEIIYNEFVSVIRQEQRALQLLPIAPSIGEEAQKATTVVDYIFEPTRADILDQLLPIYLNMQVWRTLLESNAAEQAARMMAMENATSNAKDLINSLQLIYNRERQAAITKEMLEIVGGAEALSNQ